MKVRIKLADFGILIIAVLAIAAITQVTVMAVYLGETEINVTVTDLSEVTIVPTILNFSAAPGSQSTEVSLDIKNTGSNNITNIYASVDTVTDEDVNPIPTGNPSNFSSSGFLVLKNSSDSEFYYAGRLEWNLSTLLSGASYGTNRYNATGFYRNASGDYMWIAGNNGTEGFCNATGATLYIEADEDQGTAATRTPAVAGHYDEATADWSLFNFSSGPLNGQCVALYKDCTKIYIYHWDMNTTFDGCAGSSYIKVEALVPGGIETITAQAFVSEGVPDGVMTQSTLTLHGTAG